MNLNDFEKSHFPLFLFFFISDECFDILATFAIINICAATYNFLFFLKDWASALDSRTSGPPLPLHGLPVAVKDDHNVEGLDSTLGFAKNLYQPARESAALVKILLKLGAVPFAKTNVPQSLFSSGNDNPIFGSTLNAHNPDLAPGGSSSGSGCIVAAGSN